jgi:hypothetical protein
MRAVYDGRIHGTRANTGAVELKVLRIAFVPGISVSESPGIAASNICFQIDETRRTPWQR